MAEIFPINETVNGTYNLIIYGADRCCPDIWTTFIPALVIIGFFCLFLYMAETRRDVGYAIFMMALSGMAFGDPLLASVQYTVVLGGQQANLPLLMVFVSCYEVVMTLLLMNEMNQRKKQGGQ